MRKAVLSLGLILFGATLTAQSPTFKAVLTGANETPVPADPDGVGFALVTLNPGSGTVAFTLYETSIANPVAAHIHRGAAGVSGPVIVPLNAPFNAGLATGTATGVDPSLLNAIAANPAGFYVNIHTSDFPGGAIRGQLSAAPGTSAGAILFVPVIAKLTGAHNENFVDDVRLINRSSVASNVTLDFFASNSTGLAAPTATKSVSVPAGSQLALDDLLGETFALSGIGALRISADGDVAADSRLLNDQRPSGAGTTGMAIAAEPIEGVCRNGTLGFLSNASASDAAAGLGFRTNIGYFNPTPTAATIAFTANHDDGSAIANTTVTVPGFAHAQLTLQSLFPAASASDLAQSDFFVSFAVSGSSAFVYADQADNKTGDTYFLHPACR
jgi:CHRD domain-containing protein